MVWYENLHVGQVVATFGKGMYCLVLGSNIVENLTHFQDEKFSRLDFSHMMITLADINIKCEYPSEELILDFISKPLKKKDIYELPLYQVYDASYLNLRNFTEETKLWMLKSCMVNEKLKKKLSRLEEPSANYEIIKREFVNVNNMVCDWHSKITNMVNTGNIGNPADTFRQGEVYLLYPFRGYRPRLYAYINEKWYLMILNSTPFQEFLLDSRLKNKLSSGIYTDYEDIEPKGNLYDCGVNLFDLMYNMAMLEEQK